MMGGLNTDTEKNVNAELCKKALDKIGNPNILVNLVSKRVRQMSSGGGAGRPLISETANMGAADISLLELIEQKMDWEGVDESLAMEVAGKKRRKTPA
jgi:DNA-directed RNA polymerase subunit omega